MSVKKNYIHFIGVDVSKNTLDLAVVINGKNVAHNVISNEPKAIGEHLKQLKQTFGFTIRNAVVGMEQTGIYCNHLIAQLQKNRIGAVVEHASHIRNSLGNIRGKTDKIDAERIALYLYKSRDHLKLWEPRRQVIDQLASLSTLRTRLQTLNIALKTPLKENSGFVRKGLIEQNNLLCSRSLDAMKLDIQDIEDSIEATWKSDETLNKLMTLVQSVPCVGPVIALQIIICTNEFKSITSIKKFASYAGIAPFPYKSGTSISRKTRVSALANKKMKALLHTSAVLARRYVPDIKDYYERKVGCEGKNKMLVLNAIRYKIASRIFVCVHQDRLYQKVYKSISPNNPIELIQFNLIDTSELRSSLFPLKKIDLSI